LFICKDTMRFDPKIESNIQVLESLVLQGEGAELDFKRQVTNQQKIARTLAAFANNKGGKLLIGVEDNGELIGTDAEEEMYMVHEAAEKYCDPPVDVYFTIYEFDDKCILQAEVKRSLKKPHLAPDEHQEWQIYIRANDKTLVASKTALKQLDIDDDEPFDENELDSKELAALNYLRHHDSLTAKVFSRQINISLQRANRILIKLMNLGLVLQQKDARGDYFVLR
jgi:predicted HTH transcriptional regulator